MTNQDTKQPPPTQFATPEHEDESEGEESDDYDDIEVNTTHTRKTRIVGRNNAF
ncbi:hypothetical protein PLICRDRAFT_36492 [Plicaturopsis crispa FD-325 SS-3]|nr:hypothetical protein PLICRDRAFT_36492 [Plicaturopsis crispa FD-325 SS-3]